MAADADFNAEALVEEGLQLYSRGELDSALARWREVLSREPENARARDYLRYVEENRAALEESFRAARQQAAQSAAEPSAPSERAQAAVKVAAEEGLATSPAEQATAAILTQRRDGGGAEKQRREADRETAPMEVVARVEPAAGKAAQSRLDILAGALAPVPTADTLVDSRAKDDFEISTKSPAAEPADEDPSFLRLADEIERTTQRISDEIPNTVLPGAPAIPSPEPAGRGLLDLKAKVAETKARLTGSMPIANAAGAKTAPADDEGAFDIPDWQPSQSAELPSVAEAPISGKSTLPGPPPAEEPSISSRPTPSGGSSAVPTIPAPSTSDQHRARQMTPLTLIGGGGGSPNAEHDFEPLEATPVARLPQPARLVSMPRQGEEDLLERLDGDAEAAIEELTRDNITPSSLARTPAKPKTPSPLEALAAQAPLYGDEERPHTFVGLGPKPATPAASPAPEPARSSTGSLTPVRDAVEKLESLLESARQLHEQGTFEGSLWLCERVLAKDAGSTAAKALLQKNQDMLLRQYRQQLGDPRAVPVVQIPQHEIMWHKLDHRAGFLLSRIDGQLSFEDLLDVSGMSEFEACRILSQLMSQGVIGPRR